PSVPSVTFCSKSCRSPAPCLRDSVVKMPLPAPRLRVSAVKTPRPKPPEFCHARPTENPTIPRPTPQCARTKLRNFAPPIQKAQNPRVPPGPTRASPFPTHPCPPTTDHCSAQPPTAPPQRTRTPRLSPRHAIHPTSAHLQRNRRTPHRAQPPPHRLLPDPRL